MIVFFEGIDGSGKTTTMEPVRRSLYFDHNVLAITKVMQNPREMSMKDVRLMLKELSAQAESDVIYIYDRGPISEIAYRMWDSKDGGYILSDVIKFFEKARCGVVYFDRDPLVCFEKRTGIERDQVSSVNDLLLVERAYTSILSILRGYMKVPIITYNVDIDGIDHIINFIRRIK